MEQLTLLRATAQRLSTTPVEDLPRTAGFLASSIGSCSTVLRESVSKSGDNTVPLHKLTTRLSSLLHDKTSAARYAAAIVIKSYVETAPPNVSLWEGWTRNLIICLNRQDPWQAKRVYVSTIVRIFTLCYPVLQLQREVTIPLLPAFVTATLSIIRPHTRNTGSAVKTTTSPALPFVLHSWNQILQIHGNTLRPFVNRIKPICLSLLSESHHSPQLQDLAAQVLASLHCCIPPSVSSTEWNGVILRLLATTHSTLDQVFRAVFEDWSSNDAFSQRHSASSDFSKIPGIEQVDAAEMWPWIGLRPGILRVVNLLRWIGKMLGCSLQLANIPVGRLLDLLARIMSVTIPEMSSIAQYPLRLNSEVGKEEREELWSNLPELHTSALRLCDALLLRFGQILLPASCDLTNQALRLFESEKWCPTIRHASYQLMISLLHKNSSVCRLVNHDYFEVLCKSVCSDVNTSLEPLVEYDSSIADTIRAGPNGNSNALRSPQDLSANHPAIRIEPPVSSVALDLMSALLDHASAIPFSSSTRVEMDRLAVLSRRESALYGSVMNPPSRRTNQNPAPSLIPFLARSTGVESLALEALTRPRMPVISPLHQQVVVEAEIDTEEIVRGDNLRNGGFIDNHNPEDGLRQESARVGNEQELTKDRLEDKTPGSAVANDEILGKRSLDTDPYAQTLASSDFLSQASKRPRTDLLDNATLHTSAEFTTVTPILQEPQVMKGSDGIVVSGATTLEQNSRMADSMLSFTAGKYDEAANDSDESEIPPINAQLADDLMEEDSEDQEGQD